MLIGLVKLQQANNHSDWSFSGHNWENSDLKCQWSSSLVRCFCSSLKPLNFRQSKIIKSDQSEGQLEKKVVVTVAHLHVCTLHEFSKTCSCLTIKASEHQTALSLMRIQEVQICICKTRFSPSKGRGRIKVQNTLLDSSRVPASDMPLALCNHTSWQPLIQAVCVKWNLHWTSQTRSTQVSSGSADFWETSV